jgi:two-component system sensor histidine kinase KdpD
VTNAFVEGAGQPAQPPPPPGQHELNPGRRPAPPALPFAVRFAGASLLGALGVALVTYYGYALHAGQSIAGYSYLLVVVLIAMFSGFWEATVTSLLAVTCLNYFFVPPVLSFEVAEPEDWVALAVFEVTALIVSRLSTRVRNQTKAEVHQRRNMEQLYELSRRILFLDRRQTVGPRIVCLIREVTQADAVALFDATAARMDATEPNRPELEQMARNAYLLGADANDPARGTWQRVLRLGIDSLGGLSLSGAELDKLTVDAVASLTAIAFERARSFDKESRAEAARQSEQLRAAVLDGLAHAFKTPLTAIRTASSGLMEMGALDADSADLASLIDEQSEHLSRLTTDLLQMARIDPAQVRLHRERIPIPDLIEGVLAQNQEQLRTHSLEISVPPDGLVAFGDRGMLSTALLQLVDNAAKYSNPGSPIRVAAREDDSELVVSVHNEGPSIRPIDRERIFERFYRTPESKHSAPGTGLGLSIVKKTAEAHNGRVWVVSEEGEGTTFFFALPRAKRRDHEPVAV